MFAFRTLDIPTIMHAVDGNVQLCPASLPKLLAYPVYVFQEHIMFTIYKKCIATKMCTVNGTIFIQSQIHGRSIRGYLFPPPSLFLHPLTWTSAWAKVVVDRYCTAYAKIGSCGTGHMCIYGTYTCKLRL